MKIQILFIAFFFFFLSCYAQEEPINLVYRSTNFGVGNANVYDTYLSKEAYSGMAFSFNEEEMHMTNIWNGNVSSQQIFSLDFSSTGNNSETATDYTGFIGYNYGLYYRFRPAKGLSLFAGGQGNALIGFIYNTRNGNNPATAKAHVNLNISGIASYQFQIKNQPFRIRYQANSPFIGIMFSPHYGQSYYEISLGDNDGLAHLASFHNQLAIKNVFSFEIPFRHLTMRLSYDYTAYETKVNNLETRIHSNVFYIGFSKEFFSISGKKQIKGNYRRVFD